MSNLTNSKNLSSNNNNNNTNNNPTHTPFNNYPIIDNNQIDSDDDNFVSPLYDYNEKKMCTMRSDYTKSSNINIDINNNDNNEFGNTFNNQPKNNNQLNNNNSLLKNYLDQKKENNPTNQNIDVTKKNQEKLNDIFLPKHNSKNTFNRFKNKNYICNTCDKANFVGIRFSCLTCKDYDLCESCFYSPNNSHQLKHNFCSFNKDIKRFNRTCDGCYKDPITKVAFKCTTCSDFHYCEECYIRNFNYHNHNFIILRT